MEGGDRKHNRTRPHTSPGSRQDGSRATAVCPGPGSSTGHHAAMPSPNTKQQIGAVFCGKRSIETQTAGNESTTKPIRLSTLGSAIFGCPRLTLRVHIFPRVTRLEGLISTIMSNPTIDQGSSMSHHLHEAKKILQDFVFGARCVRNGKRHHIGGLIQVYRTATILEKAEVRQTNETDMWTAADERRILD